MTPSPENAKKCRILLLDDDPDVLDMYQQTLLQLPSQPEVNIATSGARALSMLEAEPFNLLISDLRMPKMDGLQVIAIVRRKFPHLRTIILTALEDDQMRSRAYSMGIDLYLQKPGSAGEIKFLMDCIESLLDKEENGGFRGVQSKSLVDLIQLECLSHSSSVLKIINGSVEGRIWIQNGEVIDAATQDDDGEAAFRRILSWKTGNFEILPMDAERVRKIQGSHEGLLLDSAQALDELHAEHLDGAAAAGDGISDTQFFQRAGLGRILGVEFAVKLGHDDPAPIHNWGLENPEPLAQWIKSTLSGFQALGEEFEFGAVQQFEGHGMQRHLHIEVHGASTVAVGMLATLPRDQMAANVKKVMERWAS